MFISRECYETRITEARQKAKNEAWNELKALLEAKFEAQERYIKTVESENRLLMELLQEIGAEIDVQVEPTAKFAYDPSAPTEIKLVHIVLNKRFISHGFKERLERLDKKIKRLRESE